MKTATLFLVALVVLYLAKTNQTEKNVKNSAKKPKSTKQPESNELVLVDCPVEQCEVTLLEGNFSRPKLHIRTAADDVLYVGGLAIIDSDPTAHKFQVVHIFENGMVRLLRNDSRDNITTDVHISKIRPVVFVREDSI
jgi:hypothetical protein